MCAIYGAIKTSYDYADVSADTMFGLWAPSTCSQCGWTSAPATQQVHFLGCRDDLELCLHVLSLFSMLLLFFGHSKFSFGSPRKWVQFVWIISSDLKSDSPRTKCMKTFLMCISLGFFLTLNHFRMIYCTADLKPPLHVYLYWQLHFCTDKELYCVMHQFRDCFRLRFWA